MSGLSGAEKRRKRKGGNPNGGPGQRGRFRQPVRSRRGYLAPFITEEGHWAHRLPSPDSVPVNRHGRAA